MWCVEFWDTDRWDEMSGSRRKYKIEAIELADRLNKHTTHDGRKVFHGHRFRVRKVKES